MSSICWTIIHRAASPVVGGGRRVAHLLRRVAKPAVHHVAWKLHHPSAVPASSHTWAGLACKVVPAALLGGGLLAPIPANPPQPSPTPPIVQPIPANVPWFRLPQEIPRFASPTSEAAVPAPVTSALEDPAPFISALDVPAPVISALEDPAPVIPVLEVPAPVTSAPEPSSAFLLLSGGSALLLFKSLTRQYLGRRQALIQRGRARFG